jgi:hypothetical protein
MFERERDRTKQDSKIVKRKKQQETWLGDTLGIDPGTRPLAIKRSPSEWTRSVVESRRRLPAELDPGRGDC